MHQGALSLNGLRWHIGTLFAWLTHGVAAHISWRTVRESHLPLGWKYEVWCVTLYYKLMGQVPSWTTIQCLTEVDKISKSINFELGSIYWYKFMVYVDSRRLLFQNRTFCDNRTSRLIFLVIAPMAGRGQQPQRSNGPPQGKICQFKLVLLGKLHCVHVSLFPGSTCDVYIYIMLMF